MNNEPGQEGGGSRGGPRRRPVSALWLWGTPCPSRQDKRDRRGTTAFMEWQVMGSGRPASDVGRDSE
jgi:hypothetical protein